MKDASNTEQEATCDTCEYNTAAFNPCNACGNNSEYKKKGDKNMTDMEIEIYEAEHQPLWLLDSESEGKDE